MKGFVQVYTGNGKGKTSAALGLALRAAGAKKRIFIAQFVKGSEYSELKSIARLTPEVTLKQYGRKNFIHNKPTAEDILAAQNGLKEVREIIRSGKYDIVILDEANIATYFDLFSVEDLLSLIAQKPDDVELVITGRYADARIIERADLVTEMQEVKHYYTKGITAREGIEK